ncbi:SCO6880 family protein [Puerhibacterium puerhi]|uniref:SCO6880 family protein n=1 Tax=Puerhibacterium puerhi TaxID=2692623 RepID=UPI0013582E12|nr:SCO6880 family protein [Puerhibacterium puerhi]
MSADSANPVVYGNITRPSREGLLGIPMGVSLAGVPVVLLLIVMIAKQWWIAAAVTVLVGAVGIFLLVGFNRQGRSIYSRWLLLGAHRAKARRGDTLYLAGPAGKVPDGSFTLPGLMAPSELSEHRDAYGSPFGMIRLKSAKHYTVVIEAFPDGDALVDQPRIDSQVAHWGAWLAQLGVDDGIVGASVTVETAPDSGVRLSRMVRSNIAETAEPFAKAVAAEIVETMATGSPVITTRIAITFSGKSVDGKATDRGPAAMAEEIGNRLPVLLSGLWETGAGTSVRACTAQDIVDFTRTAYDPTVATRIEQLRAEGGTGLTWKEAGPVFAEDQVDRYFHDRAVSKTWQMWEPPRGMFYSSSLRRLVEPTPGVLRKRVTILYRPIPAGEATDVIQQEINNAQFSASQKHRPTARQQLRKAYATKAAEEEAKGAGLVRFGVLVTVTCARSDEFPRLDKVIPSLGNQARLRLRPALGNQAVAFQAALPLGVVLPEHSIIPTQVREWL